MREKPQAHDRVECPFGERECLKIGNLESAATVGEPGPQPRRADRITPRDSDFIPCCDQRGRDLGVPSADIEDRGPDWQRSQKVECNTTLSLYKPAAYATRKPAGVLLRGGFDISVFSPTVPLAS
jgi:hypothetical protein